MGLVTCKIRVNGISEHGKILRKSEKGEKYYEFDGGGIREAIINHENDCYYMFYDGWPAQDSQDKMCRCLLAKSKNLINWEKLGPILEGSRAKVQNSTPETYSDYWSGVSPWIIKENNVYYMYYITALGGQDSCGTPETPYATCLATATTIEGPWEKVTSIPGKSNHICFPLENFYKDTACAGHVMQNPKWRGEDDTENYKYMMFFGAASSGPEFTRGIGIARTNNLLATDDRNKNNGNFWVIDEKPLAPLEDDVENSSVYYEETNQTYFLFTNHIDPSNSYTDAIWVYWTKDTDNWNPQNKAVVIDSSNCSWAKGAIGMPTVIKGDDNTLILVHDAGDDTTHLYRNIGMVKISLPIMPENFIK